MFFKKGGFKESRYDNFKYRLFNKIFGNACFWSKIEDCVVGGHQILSI